MASADVASRSVKFSGSWRSELAEMKKGMDKIATKQAMRPLADALAKAALGLSSENATKLAPVSTMYERSTPSSFRVGTTKVGAAAHQFGATIRPISHKAAGELGRRLAMSAAREALARLGAAGGKTRGARQFVRDAGKAGRIAAIGDAVVAYLRFRVGGKWVRVRQVKLPEREIFPLKGIPKEWEETFQNVATRVIADLTKIQAPGRNVAAALLRAKGGS